MKEVTAAIIIDNNKILIAQRGKNENLAGKWEFPGGKIEIDETPQQCIKRENREELEVDIVVGNYLGESICTYSNSKIKLIAYFATILSGDIKLSVHDKVEWITISEFDEYEFAPADIPFIAKLKEIF